jgi:hypothetical protein
MPALFSQSEGESIYAAVPDMRTSITGRPLPWLAPLITCSMFSCSIAVRRDLSTIPPGQVGFDDMCSLQEYFDTIEAKGGAAPTVLSSIDLEGSSGNKTIHGGKARFAFEGEFQLKNLRRVLSENWRRLPDQLDSAERVELEVRWSEKAGVRRVVTDEEAELTVNHQNFGLPYQVCLSELLYGEPLYRQRRLIWGLPLPGGPPPKPIALPALPPSTPDAGATADGPSADAGAAEH